MVNSWDVDEDDAANDDDDDEHYTEKSTFVFARLRCRYHYNPLNRVWRHRGWGKNRINEEK